MTLSVAAQTNLEANYSRGPIRPLLETLTQFMWVERDGIVPTLFVAKIRAKHKQGSTLESYTVDGIEIHCDELIRESILDNILHRWALAADGGLGWKPVVLEVIR